MTDDNTDNPWAPPVPVEEETQKPLQHPIARYWLSCSVYASAIPVVFFAIAVWYEGEWFYSLTRGLCMFVGVPASFVAIFITSWWRLGIIYPSLMLLVCNITSSFFIAWKLTITSI